MQLNSIKVHNFENKIDIWKNAYGNFSKSKLENMEIDYNQNRFDATVKYAKAIINEDYVDIQEEADTFTYLHEIKGGYEKDTYEDIPYLIPYIVKNSSEVVIILSGGGFAYKTIDGSTSGGKRIADKLNERGISCFLLHYRSNPYKFPIPMLDLQRAIKYVRYHSNKYGYSEDDISIMGFSSGGYVCASFINKYLGKNNFGADYILDEIDNTSDRIKSCAMIYAPLTFYYNVPMIHAVIEKEKARDEFIREEILSELDLVKHINSENIPQFISYSNGDKTVNFEGTEMYINRLKQNGGDVEINFVENQDHGYVDDLYVDDYVRWLIK